MYKELNEDKCVCSICGKVCSSPKSKAAHMSSHSPKRNKFREAYEQNPKTCPYCGKLLSWEHHKKGKKFCDASHAALYNNSKRTPEYWKKQSENLKTLYCDKSFRDYQYNLKKNRNPKINLSKNKTKIKVTKETKKDYIKYIALRMYWKMPLGNNCSVVNEASQMIETLTKKEIEDFFNLRAKEKVCIQCGKVFKTIKKNRKTCSDECAKILKDLGARKGGHISVSVQSKTRRSKNEKLFAEMCMKDYDDVLTNEPMFNGWDADVILPKQKIAILWNGKWHYEQIKKGSSLSQIQNRDKIKIKEITKMGYTPYVIKDMGKYNPDFVKSEYEKFKSHFGVMEA